MKVGLFSPYLDTQGGGERYFLTLAEFFSNRGDQVDFFSDQVDKSVLEERFTLDLRNVNFIQDVFFSHTNFLKRALTTASYDLMVFLSDGSVPSTFAKKNILHFQVPITTSQRTLANTIKLRMFNAIICNSRFTKSYIDKAYNINSDVLYPPVDIQKFKVGRKDNFILSVGRFFAPDHPKKQHIMIDVFQDMCNHGLKNWDLVLAGGVFPGTEKSVEDLKRKIRGKPIKIIADGDFHQLRELYSHAAIYWHAAGYSEDLQAHPEKAEHFGITTVEAMASGAVPVVFAGGGQKEIVEDGISGFFWQNKEELVAKTKDLITNKTLRETLAKKAVDRSNIFSKEKFFRQLENLIQ